MMVGEEGGRQFYCRNRTLFVGAVMAYLGVNVVFQSDLGVMQLGIPKGKFSAMWTASGTYWTMKEVTPPNQTRARNDSLKNKMIMLPTPSVRVSPNVSPQPTMPPQSTTRSTKDSFRKRAAVPRVALNRTRTIVPPAKPLKRNPWQCVLFDQDQGDGWCGTEKVFSAGKGLEVVQTMGKNAKYPGCGACWCCMQAWPSPSQEGVLSSETGGQEIEQILHSANETFHLVLKKFIRRRLHFIVKSETDLHTLRTSLEKSKNLLMSDITLSSGKVLRYHRLLALRPLEDGSAPTGNFTPETSLPKSMEDGSFMAEFSALPVHCPTSLLGLFPVWASALKSMALARAVNNKLFFTLTDKTYRTVMPCWRWSVEAVTGLANTLIIPTDADTIEVCNEHKLPCVKAKLKEIPRIKIWGHIGFLKFYSMALISSLGIDFVFSEMDVLVLQNPWPYHEREDKVQWQGKDCRHYIHADPGRDPTRDNARAEHADIQVTSHFNHPRVNIGYMYFRWSMQTLNFLWQLVAYFVGTCADPVIGYDLRPGTYVDAGLPDQNIFDAFLRNHDHCHPKYRDIPWDKLPLVRWKLLDYGIFGIHGRHEARQRSWVTFHYAGEGRKVVCWTGICEKMRKHPKGALQVDDCVKPWQGGRCMKPAVGEAPSLQNAIRNSCLGQRIDCSARR
eukprot:TRINITY_DN43376_c0_g1_i1.p1 TRINITY_DN43376_c0_g1~~TRINITY_DN43376_c0_g1_i1.p1  ORF type:complete len:672 (+),score=69.33 TRINITY_DN43376_c0_g1_i1:169-2184(+)